EGTIFRAFDDKQALLDQVVAAVMDPGAVERRLDAVDRELPLEQRLLVVVEIMNERVTSEFQFMTAVGFARPPGDDESRRPEPPLHAEMMPRIVALADPAGHGLRVTPVQAAWRLRVLCFAGFHPLINEDRPLTPAEVVDVLLHGVLRDATLWPDP